MASAEKKFGSSRMRKRVAARILFQGYVMGIGTHHKTRGNPSMMKIKSHGAKMIVRKVSIR
jgi:hypothetical protein